MSRPLRKYVKLLRNYKTSPITVLRTNKSDLVRALSEVCYNLLYSRIKLTADQRKRLLKYKRQIVLLASKTTPIDRKREVLRKLDADFLETILKPVLPVLSLLDG
jgi:hypothetical protein